MDSTAFWLGYLYEQSLIAEAAFDLVHEDIEDLEDRVAALEHNAVQFILPQGNA